MSKVITNNITPRSGSSVGLTGDLTASGSITGTTGTFSGSVSVGGTITYEDVTNVDSVGVITARSDVSIADKIIHTGDTNTAIRFPAVDTFTVETAGSERLRVDSAGKLLVGTISDASAGSANSLVQVVTDDGAHLILGRNDSSISAGDAIGFLRFFGNDGGSYQECAAIVGRADGTHANNDKPTRLEFKTTVDGASSATERLRITSAGAAIFKSGLAEKYENAGTTLGAQTANPLSDGNVILFTGNESGNLTINFTGVHATLSNGETVSFTAILTPNNSGKITVAQVDSQPITIKWSGGSAPSAGASGQDIYTFQILKTGSGTSDYTVFGAAANYA